LIHLWETFIFGGAKWGVNLSRALDQGVSGMQVVNGRTE
jgi:hypothetical protein